MQSLELAAETSGVSEQALTFVFSSLFFSHFL
jgi:hypothetical protein